MFVKKKYFLSSFLDILVSERLILFWDKDQVGCIAYCESRYFSVDKFVN